MRNICKVFLVLSCSGLLCVKVCLFSVLYMKRGVSSGAARRGQGRGAAADPVWVRASACARWRDGDGLDCGEHARLHHGEERRPAGGVARQATGFHFAYKALANKETLH